jgi:ubiquitin conjugation factor E4 B
MSGGGFLPDLASWALRGGAGADGEESDGAAAVAETGEVVDAGPALTADEMRAQRLARMEALQKQQQEQQAAEPMDIDPPTKPVAVATPVPAPKPAPTPKAELTPKKKKAKAEPSPSDAARKLQRKKELLLKKILNVSLAGTSTSSDSSCVIMDVDSSNITSKSIAEILATRLALSPTDAALQTMPPQKPLIPYLAASHRRAAEELKTVRQQQQASKTKESELADMLQEIQNQVVSYAASCLMVPELFELAVDSTQQLLKCLTTTATDLSTSITFGVAGSVTSFYNLLMEELLQQDDTGAALDTIVAEITTQLVQKLAKCESVLDGVDAADGSAVVLVSAITALCTHKRAAEAVTKQPNFLLPAAGTVQASQQVRPAMPPGGNILTMLAGGAGHTPPYLKRSGPGIEKDTLLGLVLRIGVPKNNASFSPTSILRQSLSAVEQATAQQRRQLKTHQNACNQLIVNLIKAGKDARANVMKWFVDALLVNVGASAMRPDPSKVSSSNMLLNMSVVLLKLCEPFVEAEKKQHLIDPGFVSSAEHHGGVFETVGDNAVARLGENDGDASMLDPYDPNNGFIPQCFFFCARSLHFGIVPLLSYHENLLRHISHAHWDISNSGRDLQSDPQFSLLVSKQRSNEVALYQDEMVTDTLRFCNRTAKVLFDMEENVLRTMPEDFVSDVCDIIMAIAKLKPKMLRGIQLRYVFKLVVKLLSSKYASVSFLSLSNLVGW